MARTFSYSGFFFDTGWTVDFKTSPTKPFQATFGPATVSSTSNYNPLLVTSVSSYDTFNQTYFGTIAITRTGTATSTGGGFYSSHYTETVDTASSFVTRVAPSFGSEGIAVQLDEATAYSSVAGVTIGDLVRDGDKIVATSSDDNIKSTDAAERIELGSGDDTIESLDGNDTIDAGDGDNSIDAGDGNDSITASGDNDTLIGGLGNDTIDAGGGGDILSGGQGLDVLLGGAGADSIDGGADADVMTGGQGDDAYVVDSISDSVGELQDGGIDRVSSSVSLTLYKNVEHLRLIGSASNATGNNLGNSINGDDVKNVIRGLAGADTLVGGRGNDTLSGGADKDRLTGGADKDRFDFDSKSESGPTKAQRDIIRDFMHGTDRIDLSGIDAMKAHEVNDAFSFKKSAPFTKHAGELHFFQQGSGNSKITIIEGDIDGNGKPDFQIELVGHIDLTKGDFIL